MRKRTRIIVDMQFGSTGKGLLAGYLAEKDPCDTVVAAWGPNAGHTYIDRHGRKFIHTMLPNGVVSPALERILLGPGSVINPEALGAEITEAARLLEIPASSILNRLYIHEHAAVVRSEHRHDERAFQRIGSTSKGTAAAAIEKLRRDPDARITAGQNRLQLGFGLADRVVRADEYDGLMDDARVVQAEGAQGFSLGLNQRFYPYCTSRECTATQVMSDCNIPRAANHVKVYGTLRTYPIRVANRFDGTGKQVGTSGPYYPDQQEISFEDIGQPVELTTVTKLPRRIFTFSELQFRAALRANAPDKVFLNFMNYIPQEHWPDWFKKINNIAREYGTILGWIGFGPGFAQVQEF